MAQSHLYYSLLRYQLNMEDQTILAILKAAFMTFFFIIVLVVGSLPFRLQSFKTNKLLRTLGTTFAGALFLNVAILHILPQAANTIQDHLQDGDPTKEVFPLANLLLLCGFLVTIFFTRIISTHSHSHDHHYHESEHHHKKEGSLLSNGVEEHLNNLNNDETEKAQLIKQEENQVDQEPNDTYFLTMAMYFHTIFEGIAIGVQDNIAGFLSTAIAIAFHKWADALSMGIYYKNKHVPKKIAYRLIIGQAALNLIAIAFGWVIDSLGQYVQAIFLSISAGTFLAISTMQMLGESLHEKQYKVQKFLILLFSTGLVSSIWFLENQAFES